MLSALRTTTVPTPEVFEFCDDRTLTGAPFYVMEYVNGTVIHSSAAAEVALSVADRTALGSAMIDVLADIHSVPLAEVGLEDYGRQSGYVERQLRRWLRQWQDSALSPVPQIEAAHARLSARIPSELPATLIHGDFGIHNIVVGEGGTIRAVLDWELSTLGDPRADLGQLIARWSGLPTSPKPADPPPSALIGFPAVDDLLRLYGDRSPEGIVDIDYFVALSHWKLACIAGGVYSRFRGGAMATSYSNLEMLWATVIGHAAAAEAILGR